MIRAAGAAPPGGIRAATLGRIAFALLVVASVAALFIAQALKREAPLINGHHGVTTFPTPGHRHAHFHLSATIGGFVDVDVLSADGDRLVKRIAAHRRIHEYQKFELSWDGRTLSGAPAAPGEYLVEVHFENAGRTVIVPNFELTLRSRVP